MTIECGTKLRLIAQLWNVCSDWSPTAVSPSILIVSLYPAVYIDSPPHCPLQNAKHQLPLKINKSATHVSSKLGTCGEGGTRWVPGHGFRSGVRDPWGLLSLAFHPTFSEEDVFNLVTELMISNSLMKMIKCPNYFLFVIRMLGKWGYGQMTEKHYVKQIVKVLPKIVNVGHLEDQMVI